MLKLITSGLALLVPLSCADFIYDNESGNGDGWSKGINATDYADWIYIRLSTQDTLCRGYAEEAPAGWDFALHRYDCKTNGGAVAETDFTSLQDLTDSGQLPEEEAFVRDVESRIAVDMSGMMDGNIVYADSPLNEVLGRWLKVDTGTMPPVYAMSRKVYVLRLADGTYAAILFTDFSDATGVKGYISFDYIYPLNIN